MSYLLIGFEDTEGVRRFTFEKTRTGISAPGEARARITVDVELALARTHALKLQELPLNCVRLLDGLSESGQSLPAALVITEKQMMAARDEAVTSAAKKAPHKFPARPPSPAVGQAWRKPRPETEAAASEAPVLAKPVLLPWMKRP